MWVTFFLVAAAMACLGPPKKSDVTILPCYPDTVDVIPQQILTDTTTVMVGGMQVQQVAWKVILCVPLGTDLNAGNRPASEVPKK